MQFVIKVAVLLLVIGSGFPLGASDRTPKHLPASVLKALAGDEAEYCEHFENKKGCHQEFRMNLLWRHLRLTPSSDISILLESHNVGSCGSAGCPVYIFVPEQNGEYVKVLEEIGALESIKVLKTAMNGYYDLQKTWANGKTHTIYRWNGRLYSDH